MIRSLRRRRNMMLAFALAGVALVLGVLFSATGAMYAKDPVRELQTEKAALQPPPPPAPE